MQKAMEFLDNADYIWMDVRPKQLYDMGAIPGALSAPFSDIEVFQEFLDSSDTSKTYVVYCQGGVTAPKAAQYCLNMALYLL